MPNSIWCHYAGSKIADGGIYTIQVANKNDADGCNGTYLAYLKDSESTRPFLMSSTAKKPVTWQIDYVGGGKYTLKTADRVSDLAAKLAYSPACGSKSVTVKNSDRRSWRFIAVDEDQGIYRIVTANKPCEKPVNGRLAPLATASQSSTCATERSLTLMPISAETFGMMWKFTRVDQLRPIPTSTPSITPAPEETPTPTPPPIVSVEVPKLNIAVDFFGVTVEQFGETERAAACEALMSSSNYPPEKLICVIIDVIPFSPSRRFLKQSGVQVIAELRYLIDDATQLPDAQESATTFQQQLENSTTVNEIFQNVTDQDTGVFVNDVVPSTETVQVPESPTPTPEPTTTPSPTETPTPTSTPSVAPTPTPTPTIPPSTNTPISTEAPTTQPPSPTTLPPYGGGGGGITNPPISITSQPRNIQVDYPTASCGDMAQVTWQAPADGYVETYIVRCTPNTGSSVEATGVSNTASSIDMGPLVADRSYACSVEAVNAAGTSAPGSSASFDTGCVIIFHFLLSIYIECCNRLMGCFKGSTYLVREAIKFLTIAP